MKMYMGMRNNEGTLVWAFDRQHGLRFLDPRFDLRVHSPTGFEWGYGGSGPAQLALALLADVTGDDELAQERYQEFKRNVVSRLAGNVWELTEADVRNALA